MLSKDICECITEIDPGRLIEVLGGESRNLQEKISSSFSKRFEASKRNKPTNKNCVFLNLVGHNMSLIDINQNPAKLYNYQGRGIQDSSETNNNFVNFYFHLYNFLLVIYFSMLLGKLLNILTLILSVNRFLSLSLSALYSVAFLALILAQSS